MRKKRAGKQVLSTCPFCKVAKLMYQSTLDRQKRIKRTVGQCEKCARSRRKSSLTIDKMRADFPHLQILDFNMGRRSKVFVKCPGANYIGTPFEERCKLSVWHFASKLYTRANAGKKPGVCLSCSRRRQKLFTDAQGYSMVWNRKTKKYKRAHRIVMEELLGRKLRKNEQVHHTNADRAGYDSKYLALRMKGNHPMGISLGDAVRWIESVGGMVTMPESVNKTDWKD